MALYNSLVGIANGTCRDIILCVGWLVIVMGFVVVVAVVNIVAVVFVGVIIIVIDGFRDHASPGVMFVGSL